MSAITTLNALIENHRTLRSQFMEAAKEKLSEVFKEFFSENPQIKTIIWTQYSPYFNDGDECIFSVNEPIYTNAEGEDISDIEYDSYVGETENVFASTAYGLSTDNSWDKAQREIALTLDVNPVAVAALDEIIMSSEMEEILEEMFGNHVKVTVTEDGFDVEEYSHD